MPEFKTTLTFNTDDGTWDLDLEKIPENEHSRLTSVLIQAAHLMSQPFKGTVVKRKNPKRKNP